MPPPDAKFILPSSARKEEQRRHLRRARFKADPVMVGQQREGQRRKHRRAKQSRASAQLPWMLSRECQPRSRRLPLTLQPLPRRQ